MIWMSCRLSLRWSPVMMVMIKWLSDDHVDLINDVLQLLLDGSLVWSKWVNRPDAPRPAHAAHFWTWFLLKYLLQILLLYIQIYRRTKMCLKKHKTCCSSSDHHFWSFWRITSISICITIITISTSFISFTKCFTSFSRFQPFHWFYRFPNFHTILYLSFFHIWQTVNQPLLLLSSAAATRWLGTHAINWSHLSGNSERWTEPFFIPIRDAKSGRCGRYICAIFFSWC